MTENVCYFSLTPLQQKNVVLLQHRHDSSHSTTCHLTDKNVTRFTVSRITPWKLGVASSVFTLSPDGGGQLYAQATVPTWKNNTLTACIRLWGAPEPVGALETKQCLLFQRIEARFFGCSTLNPVNTPYVTSCSFGARDRGLCYISINIAEGLNNDWPTRWHLLYYILLNMFQTLIRPSEDGRINVWNMLSNMFQTLIRPSEDGRINVWNMLSNI